MRERRATSIDIAYRAGVSQSTVSRALRDSPLVTPETRARIQAIARELNYRVDRHAASLRSQASHTLALLIFEDATSDESRINPFFMAMLGPITRCASRQGYDLLVSFQQMGENWHTEYQMSSRADGMILLGYGDYVAYREKLEQLAENGAHFVLWGPTHEGQPGCAVSTDNRAGGYAITRHLMDLGHRHIAYLGGASEHCPEFLQRYQGYCDALREAGIGVDPRLQIDAENLEADGEAAVHRLLNAQLPVTAVCCASDLIAIGAMQGARARGRQLPRDLSITGFDDIPAAGYADPPLTTVRQDTQRASELLVNSVLDLIHQRSAETTLVDPVLRLRASSAAPCE